MIGGSGVLGSAMALGISKAVDKKQKKNDQKPFSNPNNSGRECLYHWKRQGEGGKSC